ncbi:MAG TPA: hypothetical protein DCS84_03905 [Microbacterium sp.]|uniref:LPXTG cell wall anchor domain-containing protein n=1 Tax=Microbacterium sp. UBA1612 TaxID=1946942 RepID=UPI000E91FCEA|nr:LPXTG cell wall anchor domain-containing protein [Microbacterium sp. UBA1612]HAS31439.1 hypothetical protein [Microbacterium sp.]
MATRPTRTRANTSRTARALGAIAGVLALTSAALAVPSVAVAGTRAPANPSTVTTQDATPGPDVGGAPEITSQPVDQQVPAGQDATFTASANRYLEVQWYELTSEDAIFQPIEGATSPTLTLSAVTRDQSGTAVRAVFANGPGETATRAALLTVLPSTDEPTPGPEVGSAPEITSQPVDQQVPAGQDATFTADASRYLEVQWYELTFEDAVFQPIEGATSTTLTLSAVTQDESGTAVRAVFSNGAGETATSQALLTVLRDSEEPAPEPVPTGSPTPEPSASSPAMPDADADDSTPPTTSLAATGSETPWPLAGIAGALLITGALALLTARRRNRTQS